ncbi:hypothetical protein TspCOW1_31690 [Thiohalobacter sp. COW1]|uniref:hypothetical protein n=1 Tax=Thiohalobacter sp. COW1 TaxID=2795687 RepID=UPI00191584CD|nr:hypothetical protein [Thiohalobacter sp. COW1]BCO33066.1 hypothetical protein TspCOW1_31690 [Thiohalobacter sp. COW1]
MQEQLQNQKIEQPVGLVVSGGRTGTAFLGKNLGRVFPDSVAFHEPDTIHQRHLVEDTRWVVANFGIYQGLVGKMLGRTGLRHISDKYVAGRMTGDEAAHQVIKHRQRFYAAQHAGLIIESNYAFYGLLPVLPRVFSNYKVVGIVRNPESWIRSYLKKNDRYGGRDYVSMLGLRINPEMIGDRPAAEKWKSMNAAERLAWFWTLVYSRIADAADRDPNIDIYRFEDLFYHAEKQSNFMAMAKFLGQYKGNSFAPQIQEGMLEKIENAAPERNIDETDEDVRSAVEAWCDPLRRRWGYDRD